MLAENLKCLLANKREPLDQTLQVSNGHFSTAGGDTTCGNWTKNTSDGSAIVGHHDRVGLNLSRNMKSWNSSHGSRGCGEADLPKSGGAGLFYCFAKN